MPRLSLGPVLFEDGDLWHQGLMFRPDPEDPDQWLAVEPQGAAPRAAPYGWRASLIPVSSAPRGALARSYAGCYRVTSARRTYCRGPVMFPDGEAAAVCEVYNIRTTPDPLGWFTPTPVTQTCVYFDAEGVAYTYPCYYSDVTSCGIPDEDPPQS